MIGVSFVKDQYKFTYNFHNTVKIKAGTFILAFVIFILLLSAFIVVVNSDVVKFVIYPLEAMYEKV